MPLRKQLLATTAVLAAVLLAAAACERASPTPVPAQTPTAVIPTPTKPVVVTAIPTPTPVVVTATPTPTPVVVTATPTPTPIVITVVVTATPTPRPPAATAAPLPPSGALITTDDLPERFEYIPPDELDLHPGSSINETLAIADSFAFGSSEPFEVLFGFTTILTTTIGRIGFDAEIKSPELFLNGFEFGLAGDSLAGTSIESWEKSDPDIADLSSRITFRTIIDGVDIVFDVIGFRHGDTGAYIFKMSLPSQPTDTDLVHYAQILDQRIANAPTSPVSTVKPRLVFSDVSWDSVQIQNAIVRKIAELGYGYETDSVYGDTYPLFEALLRSDTNITMEIWLPNQREGYEAALASGTIVDLGKSLADNWQSAFIIPRYTKDANPGLVSVEDLKKPEYMELFVTPESAGKARALDCVRGWSCHSVNNEKLVAYGLSEFVSFQDPGSNAALDAEIIAAFERGEDVLFYYWGPTTLTEREYNGYYILEEPEYTDACWATDKGCAYAISEVYIAVRHELIEAAPDIVALLRNWDFTGPLFIAAANYQAATDASYDEVAAWWLRNTDEWKEWVAPGVAEKVLAGL